MTVQSVGLGRRPEDAAAQAERALSNLALLLQEAGSGMDDVCKITVYISDRAYRPAVYPVIGKHFRGIHPVSTGIIMPAFARPEILFEIDAQVVPKRSGMPHTRVRPYHSNVARYGTEQQPLDCDFCMAVRAGRHVFLRGQTGVDLDEVLRGQGDAVAQAGQAMDNVAVLLAEAGARLSDVVKVSVFVTDRAFLTGVSELVLHRLAGVAPAFTVMIVKGLASPELLMEVDVTAIIPDSTFMTFSLVGRCARTGMLGAVVTTSSLAVGARCPHARANIGAVLTQYCTDPRLGPLALDLLARGARQKRPKTKSLPPRAIATGASSRSSIGTVARRRFPVRAWRARKMRRMGRIASRSQTSCAPPQCRAPWSRRSKLHTLPRWRSVS